MAVNCERRRLPTGCGRFLPGFLLAALGSSALAAEAGQPIFGFYNPTTHAFTPAPSRPPAATPIVRTGTLTINVATRLDAIPAGQQVLAFATAYLSDPSYSNAVGGQAPMMRKGATASASFKLPYIFTTTSAAAKVTVQVELSTQAAPYPAAIISTEIPLPADNADTVVTLPQTL